MLAKYYNFLVDPTGLDVFRKKDWKLVDQQLNEFYLLSNNDQEEILKLDANYLFDIYYALGSFDGLTQFSGKNYTYYLNKGLEEVYKQPKKQLYRKIYFISSLLMAASNQRDVVEINKNLFELKKAFIEAKGDDQYLDAIRHNVGTLVIFLINNEFYSELENLINFIDGNFNFAERFKKGSKITYLGNSYSYFYAKSIIERNKNNYLKAAYYLEELTKISEFNYKVVIEDLRNNRKKSIYQNILVLNVLPDLYDLYYKIGAYDKINSLTFAVFNKNTEDLNNNDLEEILVVENPIRVLNPLFSYFIKLNNKKKAEMTAKFIKKILIELH